MARRPKAAPRRAGETAYQRRIRLYKERHPGATTQQARGKKPREHVSRAEREIRQHGMTLAQQHRVDAFAIQQIRRRDGRAAADAARADPNRSDVVQKFRRATREKGYEAFVDFRNGVNRLGRQKRARLSRMLRKTSGGGDGGGGVIDFDRMSRDRDARHDDMADLADDFFDDADDDDLAYYH